MDYKEFRERYQFDSEKDLLGVGLVDEDGVECVLKNIDFRDGDTWTMTVSLLVACELFTKD